MFPLVVTCAGQAALNHCKPHNSGFYLPLRLKSQAPHAWLLGPGRASAADVMQALFISVLLTAIAQVHAFEPNTGSQLLVQAGSCAAFEFTPQPQYKFTYTLKLLSVAAAGCDRGQIQCAPCSTSCQCVPNVLAMRVAVVHALCEVAVHQTHWPWRLESGFKLCHRTG